jgi:phage tail-like protein
MLRPGGASLRADRAEVVLLAPDGQTERARFALKRCVPIKLKAPALNARDGIIAIEELQLAYESLALKRPS